MASHLVGPERLPLFGPRARPPRTRRLALALGVASWMLPCVLHADAGARVAAPQSVPTAPSPSVRPPPGDLDQRARLLFEAVVHDDPARAEPVFFPRAAFLQVKAMQNAGRYYDRLHARFAADIHALHESLPDLARAEFDHLELVKRGGFVRPGDEGNRLAYWASRHAFLVYRVGKQQRRFDVRVLITWDERWYVIHLSDF